LDRLWSPWRNKYVADNSAASACVFCDIQSDAAKDEQNFVVHRARYNFIVLNIHPYTTGHLLLVPYEHIGQLDATPKHTTDELMDLAKRSQTVLQDVYKPRGFNVGMNLGAAAGAGIQDHLHLHIMPRWIGDTNFMTTVAETRVLPEDLSTTYQKLKNKF
jgi:ATP adenylyltransferase